MNQRKKIRKNKIEVGETVETYRFIVEPEEQGMRMDVFLSENLEELSRSHIKKLIEEGCACVGEKTVKAKDKCKAGAVVTFIVPDAEEIQILPENIPLEVLYEDAHVIVINKPQGMVVHPAPGHYTGTLVNALLYHCKGELSGINGVLRPGIVHRIDKDTSGVLMAAKTNLAHQSLAAQLAAHSITRKYHAIVMNGVKEEKGTVDKPIGRNPQDRKKMAITEKNGRRAVTHYRVLERLGKYTWIEAKLETGRTHQIRVHMASIGNPLLGDMVYGAKKQPFSLQGQALHAKVLGFNHPVTGEYMEFETPLPDYFERLLQRLREIR